MNHEKAREFFSAYYEGSLEAGLRQTLEQRLRTDASLQAEYRAFEHTMEQLGSLKLEEIDVPSYLSDRIATRIEQAQEKRRSGPWLQVWLPRFAAAALFVVAIFGAVRSLQGGQSGVAPAGVLGSKPQPADQLNVSMKGSTLWLNYSPSANKSVTVTEVKTARAMQYPNGVNVPITNGNPMAAQFTVQIEGQTGATLIVVPGTQPDAQRTGSGTIRELASALADHFRTPVRVDVADLDKTLSWSFDSTDIHESATKALDGTGLHADLLGGNVLSISEH